jgi:hypothetical protein
LYIRPPPNSTGPQNDRMRPPLRSPVVRPLLFVHHRARDNLVGCCLQLSIGGRLKQQRILIYSFFAPKPDGQKGVMAFSPIDFALRAASPLAQI